MKRIGFVLFLVCAGYARPAAPPPRPPVPDLPALLQKRPSEAAAVVRRYEADRDSLHRTYPIVDSRSHHARLRRFLDGWAAALPAVDASKLGKDAQADLSRLAKTIDTDRRELAGRIARRAEVAPLVPFATTMIELEEARRRMEFVDSPRAAAQLTAMAKQVAAMPKAVEKTATKETARRAAETVARLRSHLKHWFDFYNGYDPTFSWWMAEPYREADEALGRYVTFLREKVTREGGIDLGELATVERPAADTRDVPDLAELLAAPVSEMQGVIRAYQGQRGGRLAQAGVPAPGGRTPERNTRQRKLLEGWQEALGKLDFDRLSFDGQIDYLMLRNAIQRDLARLDVPQSPRGGRPRGDGTAITGRPIGRRALEIELAGEMIPYSAEQLMAIAEKEFAWCEAEMKKAARDMGYDDWRKALEKVKTLHAEPGKQPGVIRDLAREAVDYLRKHDLVTLPPIAVETWRMEMMSPRRQLVSPFFTGGEVISVSFPTSTMPHEAKLQSMRGNNVHFSRATVHHELIPGHHLQGYMTSRHKPYRGAFSTPFWTEGWALYWELVLYKRGFPATAEDRVGFLFWRSHRCARIIFSLGFHLGKMTPQQCIDLLVDRVGHERDNATAEVRRSFGGGYGPLYQAAYLLGGLQLRALREELVDAGKMGERAFHDAILRESRIPITMVRAALTRQKLTRDFAADWRFYGDVSPLPSPR
jgi:uncharacterized protein (DUF885 family)